MSELLGIYNNIQRTEDRVKNWVGDLCHGFEILDKWAEYSLKFGKDIYGRCSGK